MAIGKNKRMGKKKTGKKKPVDPFTRKEWYDVKVPSLFTNRVAGKTPINRTAGQKIASEEMKGRVFEISLGDLNKSSDADFRKMRLVVEEVQGKDALCNFYGMDTTRDKLASLFRKCQTTIEASVDVRTTDGYVVRMFAIAFTARQRNQKSKTSYAQTAQVRQIRKRMVEIMRRNAASGDLRALFTKLVPEAIGTEITTACKEIYPLKDVCVRKVKMVKRPKFDLDRLMDVHGSGKEDTGAAVQRDADLAKGKVEGLASSGGRL
ncbi:RPS1 [Symbiodinium sp. KB8]|jgi:small subunit ribosomal protein S3Ae|nr:RPS1 [Symbiodinium sp. KB8]